MRLPSGRAPVSITDSAPASGPSRSEHVVLIDPGPAGWPPTHISPGGVVSSQGIGVAADRDQAQLAEQIAALVAIYLRRAGAGPALAP